MRCRPRRSARPARRNSMSAPSVIGPVAAVMVSPAGAAMLAPVCWRIPAPPPAVNKAVPVAAIGAPSTIRSAGRIHGEVGRKDGAAGLLDDVARGGQRHRAEFFGDVDWRCKRDPSAGRGQVRRPERGYARDDDIARVRQPSRRSASDRPSNSGWRPPPPAYQPNCWLIRAQSCPPRATTNPL